MSRLAMEWGWRAGTGAKLDATALAVLQSLAFHANPETGQSFPEADTIAGELRLHKGTVRRAFERIEEKGILEGTRRRGTSILWIFPVQARAPVRAAVQVRAPVRAVDAGGARIPEAECAHLGVRLRAPVRAKPFNKMNKGARPVPTPVDNSRTCGCDGSGLIEEELHEADRVRRVLVECACQRDRRRGKVPGRSAGPCDDAPNAGPSTADASRDAATSRAGADASPTIPPKSPAGSRRTVLRWERPVQVTPTSDRL